MSENVRLSANQLEAIRLICKGHTMSAVSARVGVVERTVRRWRNENDLFRRTLEAEANRLMRSELAALQAGVSEPIEYLFRIIREPCEKELKIRACSELLKHAVKLSEIAAKAGTPGVEGSIAGEAREAEWVAIRTAIVDALVDYPDARGAVLRALEGIDVA